MPRRILTVALFADAALLAIACGGASHIYQGRAYIEGRDCLGTPSSVDVVTGDEPGTCAPVCLSQPLSDAGRKVYVSAMCAPYPYPFDAAGTDPLCGTALAAFGRDDTCIADGGSTHPVADAATE